MSAPQAAASSAQASQAGLAAVVSREVDQAWHLLNPADLQSTLPQFKAAVLALSHRYGLASGALAAQFYQQMRRDAGIAGRAPLKVADPATAEQVSRVIDWATGPLWGQSNIETAQTNVHGAAEKLVLDVGRNTIIDSARNDREASGWARIPEPGACYFCALLATRGAVYKQNTAGFRSHDHCRCHAEPVFTAYEPTAQIRDWERLYAQTTSPYSGHAKVTAFRQAFEGRVVTGGKELVKRAAEPKVGKTGRTVHEIESELAALEANLPKLSRPGPITYHQKRIAELKKLLGR